MDIISELLDSNPTYNKEMGRYAEVALTAWCGFLFTFLLLDYLTSLYHYLPDETAIWNNNRLFKETSHYGKGRTYFVTFYSFLLYNKRDRACVRELLGQILKGNRGQKVVIQIPGGRNVYNRAVKGLLGGVNTTVIFDDVPRKFKRNVHHVVIETGCNMKQIFECYTRVNGKLLKLDVSELCNCDLIR